MRAYQRGVGCVACLVVTLVVLFFAMSGLKVVQAYLQNTTIDRVLSASAKEANEKALSNQEIVLDYVRRASVEGIPEIRAEDIDIDRSSGVVALSAEYTVTLPLFYNASLLLDFKPHSEGKP